MKILVVEDDTRLARFLLRILVEEGYSADVCANGAEAVPLACSGVYTLMILDWMLPEMDGLAVCRAVRKAGLELPILMLTARGELRERVLGLNSGADDYLVKPFEIDELLARIRALQRRSAGLARWRSGDLEVDRLGRRLLIKGAPTDLTSKEFALLLHLVHHADRVVTRTELLSQVWDLNFDPGTNLVDVHVSRLRAKLGPCGWMIETVRGIGYRLRTVPP